MYPSFGFNAMPKTGFSLFSKINLSSILSGAQKTLSFANQAIPFYYQVKPIIKNLKTFSKIGKELTNNSVNNTIKNNIKVNTKTDIKSNNNYNSSIPVPNFFI